MGLFSIFTGKSAEDYERKGDALARDKVWGEAKLAYEAGLDKAANQTPVDPALGDRLREKLYQTKESLAMAHHQNALELMESGCREDARELFVLALDLTQDPQLKADLDQQIRQASVTHRPVIQMHDEEVQQMPDESEDNLVQEDMDEYFHLISSALPDDIRHDYRSYGYRFKQGYVALNRGEFDQAVGYLMRAAEENPSPQSLVPLELATAYANLGQSKEARVLLEKLVQHRTDVLPAYQLLCDIYWEEKQYDKAMMLLDTLPPELGQSMGAYQIRGETYLQAGRFEEAESFFKDLLERYGWNESAALGQARANEGLGRPVQARDLYRALISQCSGCGSRIDPSIKRKYADLSMDTGNYTTDVLEYYLELSQKDPANAISYFQNISHLYSELGNDDESRRFQSIAEDLSRQLEDQ